MKKFALKITLLLFLFFSIALGILNRYLDGYVDMQYPHFLQPASSLVLGSSRAHFGIDPSQVTVAPGLLNFAFTSSNSPYGPVYFSAIKKKLEAHKNKKGIFILEVNPFTLSGNKTNAEDDPDKFSENDLYLGKQVFYNMDPNYEFIFRNLTPLYKIPFQRLNGSGACITHPNGWIEVSMDMTESVWKARKAEKMKDYVASVKEMVPSQNRINSFKELIAFFQNYGEVFIIRVPVAKEMYNLENQYWPDFVDFITKISVEKKIAFFDLQNDFPSPITVDASHLKVDEAKAVSSFLNDKIAAYLKGVR